jgi:hypothetical protein
MDQVELDMLSGHALRARLAAENRLRCDLVALGLESAPPIETSWNDWLASHRETEKEP